MGVSVVPVPLVLRVTRSLLRVRSIREEFLGLRKATVASSTCLPAPEWYFSGSGLFPLPNLPAPPEDACLSSRDLSHPEGQEGRGLGGLSPLLLCLCRDGKEAREGNRAAGGAGRGRGLRRGSWQAGS